MAKISEECQRLYHYTSPEGLQGILKSQSLWAKQYIHLNDEKEIKLFIDEKLPEFIKPHLTEAYTEKIYTDEEARTKFFSIGKDLNLAIEHDRKVIGDCLFDPLDNQFYICSFSSETEENNISNHGQLSQWRAYGKNGGYCIVFNTSKLEKLMHKEYDINAYAYFSLCDVIYSDDLNKYKRELQNSLDNIAKFVKSIVMAMGNESIKEDFVPYEDFLNCITRYKHFGFKEEKEIRFVCSPSPEGYEEGKKKVEIKKQKHHSYIDLFANIEEKLPIEKIIVGPHKDKNIRAEKLKKLLKDTEIEVTISEIPYIGRRS